MSQPGEVAADASVSTAHPEDAVANGRSTKPRWPLRTFASALGLFSAVLAALLTAGAVYLHALGLVYQGVYLHQFGVASGQFPASASELMLFGYLALIERGIWFSTSWMAQPGSWLTLGAIYVYVRFVVWSIRLPITPLTNIPRGLALAVRELGLLLALVLGAFLLTALMALFLWGLLSPGHFAGVRRAEKDVALTLASCDACITIRTETGSLKGLLVAASESDVAIFVPAERLTHVISRSTVKAMTSTVAATPTSELKRDEDSPPPTD